MSLPGFEHRFPSRSGKLRHAEFSPVAALLPTSEFKSARNALPWPERLTNFSGPVLIFASKNTYCL
jgi:hypothetical protein